MIGQGLAAGLSVALVLLLCRGARRSLLSPLPLGEHQRLTVLLRVSGQGEGLEETVDALHFLQGRGVLPGEVVVLDEGMDEETRRRAEALAGEIRGVKLWKREKSSS